MISFELTDEHELDQLEVYLDADGLAALMTQLAFLADGKTDHIHLMAESWGGSHLSEMPLTTNATSIRHVKITLR